MSKHKYSYHFVNGVRNRPENADLWTDQAVSKFEKLNIDAHAYEFWTFAMLRWWRHGERSRAFAIAMNQCSNENKIVVAHSYGEVEEVDKLSQFIVV